jgi:hypothetical protein
MRFNLSQASLSTQSDHRAACFVEGLRHRLPRRTLSLLARLSTDAVAKGSLTFEEVLEEEAMRAPPSGEKR